MENDFADYCLNYALSKGASFAESRLEHHDTTSIELKNGVVEATEFQAYSGIGLRFIAEGGLGIVSLNEFDKTKAKRLIDSAIKLTSRQSLGKKIVLSEEKPVRAKYEVKQKQKLSNVDFSKKAEFVSQLDKAITGCKAKVSARFISFGDSTVRKYYVNSEGTKIESLIPRIQLFYFLTLVNAGQSAQRFRPFGSTGGFEKTRDWNILEHTVSDLEVAAKTLEKGVSAPKQAVDVVLGPEITGIACHESGGHPYEADRIKGRESAQAGESFIEKNSVGKKIGSSTVTVVDDPTIEGSFGYYKFDDEGVKARRRYLQKNGVITEFLHDRQTAAEQGVSSNGCSRASDYDKEPLLRMSNTFMLPGDYSFEELIEDVKLGVFLKSYQEWNIDDMRLNQKYVGFESYLIENGELTKLLKKPALELTTPTLYSSITAVGKKIEFFAGECGKGEPMQGMPVSMGGPAVKLRKIKLA